MSLLLESIKVEQGHICNLEYHQARVTRSSRAIFNMDGIDLNEIFRLNECPENGTYKCRLIYDQQLRSIEYLPYVKRTIAQSLMVDAFDFTYPHKYLDRTFFDDLKIRFPQFDEIILYKDGLITDSCFSNLAFYDGTSWFTPENPLLPGTKRQQLLDQGKIQLAKININDLQQFQQVSFINAMLNLGESSLPITSII